MTVAMKMGSGDSVRVVTDGPLAAVQALVGILRQVSDLVESLADSEYCQKPVGVVPSSIGGHLRHDLDHLESLLQGLSDGAINYDDRRRGTEVERSRTAALIALHRLEDRLLATEWPDLDQPLTLTSLVSPDLPPIQLESTVGRELAFVLSHTIHHNALIGVMAKLLGAPIPDGFGYAPSTITHHRSKPCAL